MVGQGQWKKPSRSDEVVDPDEQARIADQIRAQFEALAPKRPIKPNRSEPDQEDPTVDLHVTNSIPELHKLHSLQSQSHDIVFKEGWADAQDEFVETEYYKKLASIDKQHHATGTGFIKVVTEGAYEIHHLLPQNHVIAAHETKPAGRGYKCNPATNDWLPNVHDQQHHQVIHSFLSYCSLFFLKKINK
ncbi:uncharacterized protein LOC107642739 isoform X2 [Arachis ipaensis]|uniref:uncharacterized protein LOC107642739 isoform X2 n=1 Tax=Arachis ipaensis TaxID=130454 RepID=UPI000A2B4CA6|nr:uncharacterized protein LOC107642739 isoform X2 [Arachis ipaensis]